MKKLYGVLFAAGALIYVSACNDTASNQPPVSTAAKSDTTLTSNVISTARGEELFKGNCGTCHGISGNARNNNSANLQLTTLDSLSIAQTIKHGRGAMPPFGGTFDDSDISQIVLYVLRLRK